MYRKWILLCSMTLAAAATSACEDEILVVDLPRDASVASRDGASADASAAASADAANLGVDVLVEADTDATNEANIEGASDARPD